jgi:biopolymer transport protein ExbD
VAAGGGNEPNLTPFIDLFSVLVCFLLMTAAWIQLEVMPTNIEKAAVADAPTPDSQPPPPQEKKVQLIVDLAANAVTLREDDKSVQIADQGTELDVEGVKQILTEWKTRHPEKNDVILNTEANVMYGQMIRMYDVLVANQFPDVGINPR